MKNKKIKSKLLAIFSLSLITSLVFFQTASAGIFDDIGGSITKDLTFIALVGVLLTFVPFSSLSGVLSTLLNWLLSIFTFIAVISFIITGMMFIFSGSDPTLREKAKSGLIYSIIGIAVGISGWVILNTVVKIMDASI